MRLYIQTKLREQSKYKQAEYDIRATEANGIIQHNQDIIPRKNKLPNNTNGEAQTDQIVQYPKNRKPPTKSFDRTVHYKQSDRVYAHHGSCIEASIVLTLLQAPSKVQTQIPTLESNTTDEFQAPTHIQPIATAPDTTIEAPLLTKAKPNDSIKPIIPNHFIHHLKYHTKYVNISFRRNSNFFT